MIETRPCDFYVFGVIDGQSEQQYAVCEDPSDCIFIEGQLLENDSNNPGEIFEFETKAYRLKEFADEYGLDYFEHGYDFDVSMGVHKIY